MSLSIGGQSKARHRRVTRNVHFNPQRFTLTDVGGGFKLLYTALDSSDIVSKEASFDPIDICVCDPRRPIAATTA